MPELDGDDDWPDRAEMLAKTGVSLTANGDTVGARACYQLAIDSGHPRWAPYGADHLGAVLAGQGDTAGARAYRDCFLATLASTAEIMSQRGE